MSDADLIYNACLRAERRIEERVDLLDGLDKAAREKVLANIADFLGESAQQQLLAEVPEYA